MAPFRKELHYLLTAAAEAGFRLDRFLEMLQAGSPGVQKE
jgi:hypothetical protein